jgi:gibberellin A4 carboxyl methyltransferase
MTVTTGMVGRGFYNRHSAPQWAAIDYTLPWLEAALGSMNLPPAPDTITLADFGCSEGKNSIAAMQRLLPALRRRTARPLATIHSDLATNDFSELFMNLRADGRSAFQIDSVYSGAVAGSMYDQLLPPASICVATTFNAIGYLSRRPLDRLRGFILPNGPSAKRNIGTVSKQERAVFAQQAADDVSAFLTARAAELVPGGKLLIEVFGASSSRCGGDGIYDALNDAIIEICHSGRITTDAYERYYQPIYFRTLEELVMPVVESTSPLSSMYRLERSETYEVTTPFVEDYRTTGDAATFAQAYTNFFRAFTEPVLRIAFSSCADIDALVSDVFSGAERLIRENPDTYMYHYVCVAALMTRL